MAGRKRVIWTPSAKQELQEILCFFRNRNGDNIYSKKLRVAFRQAERRIKDNEKTGMRYEGSDYRCVFVEKNYQLFYQITENQILIIRVWDVRRNSDDLNF
jgi:toxin YoeB